MKRTALIFVFLAGAFTGGLIEYQLLAPARLVTVLQALGQSILDSRLETKFINGRLTDCQQQLDKAIAGSWQKPTGRK